MCGHPPPRREAGQVAPTVPSRSSAGGGLGTDFDCDGGLIALHVAPTLNAHFGDKMGLENQHINGGCGHFVAHALRGEGFDASKDGTGRRTPIVPVAIQERAVSENPDAGPDGKGYREDGASYTLEARSVPQAVAFSSKDYGGDAMEGVSPTLRAGGHDGSHANAGVPPAIAFQEIRHADAYEADASSALSSLRRAVGEKAFQQWGLGVLAAFQSPEVLRAWLHGASLRSTTEEARPRLDDGALPRAESGPGARLLRTLWEEGPDGRSPQGRGLAKQLAGKPGEALSVLPHEGASAEADVQLVRAAREGARLLRQALSEMEAVGRPSGGEGQPEHPPYAVRRLTPREAERLQGFPRSYTRIPYRKKTADACPDGPRYKALGNSIAINCLEFIAERIAAVEDMA
jgi:DNA (cytosine-5)-methyltransferase 1